MKPFSAELLDQVETLLNIGIALSGEKDHNRLLEMIVTEARRVTGADAGTLYLCENNHLVFRIIQNETLNIYKGGKGEQVDLPPVPMKEENVASWVAIHRQTVNFPDVYNAQGFDFSGPKNYDRLTGYRTCSMLVVPLCNHEDEIIGVLQLINARDENGQITAFAPHFEKVVTSLASQAAIALTNMQFMKDIENLFRSFVEVMATAIDARTPYNANHTRRVASLCESITSMLNQVAEGYWGNQYFDEERTEQLVMAAWLHDVGKIAVPLTVMNKATRLEDRLELVLQRLDYVAASLQAAALNAQLNGEDNRDFEKELSQVEAARDLILKVNEPSVMITPEIAKELSDIKERVYLDRAGQTKPWLTPEEAEALSVVRGTLTEEERRVMENHVQYTNRMLAKIPFTRKYKDVPYWAGIHHEHLDGKGYPLGLQGDSIPPEGRILALLDIFDALTAADRPYKKGMSPEEAIKIMGFMVKDGKLDGELLAHFSESGVWENLD